MSRLTRVFAGQTKFCRFWCVSAQKIWAAAQQNQQNDLCVMRLANTQISAGDCTIWSETSLYALWVAKDPNFLQVNSDYSDQPGHSIRLVRCPGWSESSLGTSLCWFCRVMAHISSLYCLSKYFQIIMHYFKWDCSHCWLVYLLIVNIDIDILYLTWSNEGSFLGTNTENLFT